MSKRNNNCKYGVSKRGADQQVYNYLKYVHFVIREWNPIHRLLRVAAAEVDLKLRLRLRLRHGKPPSHPCLELRGCVCGFRRKQLGRRRSTARKQKQEPHTKDVGNEPNKPNRPNRQT